jgi:3-hydroxy-9,10-secoandrosta-1,3,5(10)-triene-9,17-dione monooxygenase
MPEAQRRYGDAQGLIDTAEAALFGLAAKYTELCRGEQTDGIVFSDEAARRLQRSQAQCVELCWQAVDLMFRSAGTSSATSSSMLGRFFRNLAVIRTHITIQSDQTSTNVGRIHFGLPPLSAF